MIYRITYTDCAAEDVVNLKRSEPKAHKKLLSLLDELAFHPKSGTGRPKPLKGNRSGQWSRRIDQKHRLIYAIDDDVVVVLVLVLSAMGHYDDK